MSFLNPALLWGLLALAVPIIIHFFNLQRPKQVLFSNVAFVKEVKKTVVKRLKFKQWLLLATRLLAVAALVFAFANPVIMDSSSQTLKGNRSVAVVIDNSFSMTAGNEKGPYFQQAISLARSVIRAYNRQDEFLIMGSDDLKLQYNFGTQEEALEALREIELGQQVRSHEEILSFEDDLFRRAANQVHELYFLSDFQQSTIMADSQTISLQDSNLLVKYIPLATRAQQNVFPAKHEIRSRILTAEKPIEMAMELVNDSESSVRDLSVRVMLEGKTAAISNTSLEPQETQELSLAFTPTQTGWLSGYIDLDDNPIDFDNRRYFSFYIPEKEKVLLVEGQSSRNVRILYESLFAGFDTRIISARDLSTIQLNEYRSLVLMGIEQVSSGLASRLSTYVNEGGSIMLFPGEKADVESLNVFTQAVGLGRLSPAVTLPSGKLADKVDLKHPIFDGVFTREQENRRFDAPKIFAHYPLSLNNTSIHNRILSMDGPAPILVESRLGQGTMFTFTIYPGDAWTDLHVKSIFTPLLYRATQILNQTQQVQVGQQIGSFTPYRIRTNNQELINLITEDNRAITPEQYTQGGATTLNFERMDLQAGNYQIVQGDSLLEKLAFNISDQESRLAYVGKAQLESVLLKKGYSNIMLLNAEPEEVSQRIQQEKEGNPLWKYFILASLLFLVAEIVILRVGYRPSA